ncbi:MAG: DUF2917 domain-containing protein [Proteobacteria bacterium]|uniref:DUF2917 domain-containing protein n=1 Tax=Aquabacterium sp. TaxID=1872578 RepID=UPI0035C76020|nr:DUF2917 domain-containing protein [Pseudomonadota bacterium]
MPIATPSATPSATAWRLVGAPLSLLCLAVRDWAMRCSPGVAPPPGVSHVLAAGQVLRLSLRRGEVLRVRVGGLWLTRTGDPRDHIVQPGAGFVATRGGPVVVQAFGACACHVERHRLPGRGMGRWGLQGAGGRGDSSRE